MLCPQDLREGGTRGTSYPGPESAWVHESESTRAGFTNRLYKLKPRASRSMGASSKLWYAWSQLLVYDQLDKYSRKFMV